MHPNPQQLDCTSQAVAATVLLGEDLPSGLEPSADSPEKMDDSPVDDAHSNAFFADSPPSPGLSALTRLVAGLTSDERAILALIWSGSIEGNGLGIRQGSE